MFESILESVLNEINAEDAYNKFYSSIDIDDYNNIISAYGGKFDSILKFLLNCIKSNDCSVNDVLTFISKYRDKNLPNQIRIEINNKIKNNEYENFIDIEDDLNNMLNNGVVTLSTFRECGYTVLYNDEKYLLTCTTTYAANHHYYGNSKWCTASDRFGRYDGWLYFLRYTINNDSGLDYYPDIENLTPSCVLAQFTDKLKKQTYQMQTGFGGFGQICDFNDESISNADFLLIFPKKLKDLLMSKFRELLALQRDNFNKELRYQQSRDEYVEKKRQKIEERNRIIMDELVNQITEKRNRKFDFVNNKFDSIKNSELLKNKDFIKQIICTDRLVKVFNGVNNDDPSRIPDEDIKKIDSILEKQGYAYPVKFDVCGNILIALISPVFGMVPTIDMDNNDRPYITQMLWVSVHIDGKRLQKGMYVLLKTNNDKEELSKLSKSLSYNYVVDEEVLKNLSIEQVIGVYSEAKTNVVSIKDDLFGKCENNEDEKYLVIKTKVKKTSGFEENEKFGGLFKPESIKNRIINTETMATFEMDSYDTAFFCHLAFNRLFASRTNLAFEPVVRTFELNKDTLELIDSYYNFNSFYAEDNQYVITLTRAEDGEIVIFCNKGKINTGIKQTNKILDETRVLLFYDRFLVFRPNDAEHSYIFDLKYGKFIFNGVRIKYDDRRLYVIMDNGEEKDISQFYYS